MSIAITIALFAAAFFLGSIPWGLIISRLFYHTDIREHGSGNIGTTNAMRVMGKAGGAAVFALDFGKGLLSGALSWAALQFLIAYDPQTMIQVQTTATATVASVPEDLYGFLRAVSFAGCVWGHIFSPWLKFKGGKGIAVAIGCLFVTMGPLISIAELLMFAILVLTTRYVSVGSIAAAGTAPFCAFYYFWGNWPAAFLVSVAALTIVWAHRGNIERLRAGTERRVGDKKKE